MSPLSFDNVGGIETRIVALTPSMKKMTTATNFVNFGPVTPEILRCICTGGDCREANRLYALCWSNVIRQVAVA